MTSRPRSRTEKHKTHELDERRPSAMLVMQSLHGVAINLLRLLRVQKRCARIILDASYSDNSVELFSVLGWLSIDDVIRMRKLCVMYKIVNGCCSQYFRDNISYVNDMQRHNTRASTNNIEDITR